ncbi:MAG TPA: ribosome silencing factor [Haloplasmataceae bacterium]
MSLLKIIINAILDVNGHQVEVLDMREKSPLFDYMVLCSATNERQLAAIVDNVVKEVHKHEFVVKHVEGKRMNFWVLIDCIDVVVHVFTPEERAKYNLEKLWGDCERVDLEALLDA